MFIEEFIVLNFIVHVVNGQVPEVSVTAQDASGVLNQTSTVTCTYIINSGTYLSAAWYSGTSTGSVANELVHSNANPTNGRYNIDVTQPGIATLTITDTTLSDEGYYTCLVNNDRGRSESGTASLVVLYFNSLIFTITNNPVTEGSPTVFDCSVDAKPDALIILTKDGQEVSRVTAKELVHTIINVDKSDAGTYTCQATNDAGHMFSELELVVHYGPETPLLEDLIFYPGKSRTISIDVPCNPTCTYLWNTDLPGSEDAVKNEATFTLTASMDLEDGQLYTYNLTVSNIIGSKDSSAKISISIIEPCDESSKGLTVGMVFVGIIIGVFGVTVGQIGYTKIKQYRLSENKGERNAEKKKQETYMEYMNKPSSPTYQDLQHGVQDESDYVNVKTKNTKT